MHRARARSEDAQPDDRGRALRDARRLAARAPRAALGRVRQAQALPLRLVGDQPAVVDADAAQAAAEPALAARARRVPARAAAPLTASSVRPSHHHLSHAASRHASRPQSENGSSVSQLLALPAPVPPPRPLSARVDPAAERLRFMMSGLRPHGAIVLSGIGGKGPKAAPLGGQQLLRSKLPDAEAALEAEAARQHVVRLIAEREATIDALRHLLPSPRGVVQRRRATRALLLTPDASAQLRQRLAQLISQLRWCGSRICDAVGVWKGTLRSRYAYFRSMPEREMTFFHEVSEQRPPKGGAGAGA